MRVKSPTEIVLAEFRQCLLDLISGYTQSAVELDDPDLASAGGELAAIIGLCDPQVSASISLTTSRHAAAQLVNPSPIDPCDWLGELSNQLAGRLKNRLITYGRTPMLSTPTTVCGVWLEVEPMGLESFFITARFGEHQLIAQLTLELAEDLMLEQVGEVMSIAEGSVELF